MGVDIKKAKMFLKLKDNAIRNCGIRTIGYKLVISKVCLEIIMKFLSVKTGESYLKPLKECNILEIK